MLEFSGGAVSGYLSCRGTLGPGDQPVSGRPKLFSHKLLLILFIGSIMTKHTHNCSTNKLTVCRFVTSIDNVFLCDNRNHVNPKTLLTSVPQGSIPYKSPNFRYLLRKRKEFAKCFELFDRVVACLPWESAYARVHVVKLLVQGVVSKWAEAYFLFLLNGAAWFTSTIRGHDAS